MDLQELKQQINDESLPWMKREHAYFRYWTAFLASVAAPSRQDLAEMLQFAQWQGALGDLVADLCRDRKITLDDAQWMKNELLPNMFAYKQLMAVEIVHNAALNWPAKYVAVTDLKANWAISQVLQAVPANQIEAARYLITASALGKNTKRWQIEILVGK